MKKKWSGGYEHTQSISSNTWSIAHNLNTSAPIVEVWIETGSPLVFTRTISTNVNVIDENNVDIIFSSSHVGKVFVG